MNPIERAGLALLHRCDPERAHGLSLAALRAGLVSLPGVVTSERLAGTVAGLSLPNPVGLAAGYDKNAVALAALMRSGFGFVEVGAATPRPQQAAGADFKQELLDEMRKVNEMQQDATQATNDLLTGQRDDLEVIMRGDDVQCLRPDRAGRAEDGDALHLLTWCQSLARAVRRPVCGVAHGRDPGRT